MSLNMTVLGVIDGYGMKASWHNGVDQMHTWGIAPEVIVRIYGSVEPCFNTYKN